MNTDGPITFTGLIKFLQYIKGPDHWHDVGATGEPAFANSWVNYGSPYQDARFMKDATGVVHIQGLVKDGTIGDAFFTLPAGYRPDDQIYFANLSNGALGSVEIHSDGTVVSTLGNNTYVSISCSFYVG